ncbi:MAG: family transposase [Geminicoccaceae bacterium]|jgi:transposase|nr:family transposase [Geminicoccaceae bacterium]
MTRLYSLDLRQRIVRAVEAGASRRATAAQLEVSLSCVVKLVQRWRRNGTPAPDPVGGGRRAKLGDHAWSTRCWRRRRRRPARLVFSDATWATTAMTRPLRGARRGRRVVAAVPHGDLREAIAATGARLLYPPTL